MSDYIKREDAIFVALQQPLYSVVSQIKSLDGIEIPQWIPCSERLPSEHGEYLVALPFTGDETMVITAYYGKPQFPNRPVEGRCWYDADYEYGDVVWDDVIAWMPLPKPYRKGERDDGKRL